LQISPTERGLIELGQTSPTDIHLLIDLDPSLDLRLLEGAWAVLITRHPVLSMRPEGREWVPGPAPPLLEVVWDDRIWSVPERGGTAALRVGPMGTGTRIAISADHAAVDGRALLQLADELRTVYATLAAGGVPDDSPDTAPRSLGALVGDKVSFADRIRVATDGFARWSRLPGSSHIDPAPVMPDTARVEVAAAEVADVLERLRPHREAGGWSTDGALVGLLTLAWADVFGHEPGGPSGWLLATDLRPFFGLAGGMGNLSGTEPVVIPEHQMDTTPGAVSAASEAVDSVRSLWPGAGPEVLAGFYRWMPATVAGQAARWSFEAVRGLRYTRILSNLGRAPEGLAQWSGAEAKRVVFVPPLATPPYVSLMLLTVGESSLLTARVGGDWFTADHMAAVAEAMRRRVGQLG
jgi:hypothetical protein